MTSEPAELFRHYQQRFNTRLDQELNSYSTAGPAPDGQQRLLDAMAYSATAGGKRIRPLFVYLSAAALDTRQADHPDDSTDCAALAVELVHCYSLIHDDLPAMDDDAVRRGRPSCHIAFDEATAILAGDALQALAFDVLSRNTASDSQALRLQLVADLARAAGPRGMVGGQAIDLSAIGQSLTHPELAAMHQLKTGALISAAITMGARCGGADPEQLEALQQFGAAVGLAFQIQDDVLDVEGESATLGKTAGADQAMDKPTFTSAMGLAQAKREAQAQLDKALAALARLPAAAEPLAHLARYITARRS